ncbi:MAG: R3H domain-containing nucleic acid-binding protein [Patescibacteria group bacterium]|nr:KH domain-containing protein [Patescibacteria group bacterium]
MELDIQDIVSEILSAMQIPFGSVEVEMKEDGRTYRVNISSEESSLLIGKHGENLQALQSIAKLITYRKFPDQKDFSIEIDVDNYRKRQEDSVIEIANRKADYVRQTGSNQSLPPMSPYFRRVVHMHLMQPEFDDLETESSGQGNFRKVVIKLAN